MAFPFPLFVHPEWHVQAVRRGTKDTSGSSLPPNEFREEKTYAFHRKKHTLFAEKTRPGKPVFFGDFRKEKRARAKDRFFKNGKPNTR
jgi:hypothetical protein